MKILYGAAEYYPLRLETWKCYDLRKGAHGCQTYRFYFCTVKLVYSGCFQATKLKADPFHQSLNCASKYLTRKRSILDHHASKRTGFIPTFKVGSTVVLRSSSAYQLFFRINETILIFEAISFLTCPLRYREARSKPQLHLSFILNTKPVKNNIIDTLWSGYWCVEFGLRSCWDVYRLHIILKLL